MSSAVDALALDDWWVMDVGLHLGEGRNRRRRANSEDLRATPVLKGGPDGVQSNVSGVARRCPPETSTDDNWRHSVE